jgi:hypothetical protein
MKEPFVPSWIRHGRPPAFATSAAPVDDRTFEHWSHFPTLDVLKLQDNEGLVDLSRELNVLFVSSGDLRSIIKTVTELPDNTPALST